MLNDSIIFSKTNVLSRERRALGLVTRNKRKCLKGLTNVKWNSSYVCGILCRAVLRDCCRKEMRLEGKSQQFAFMAAVCMQTRIRRSTPPGAADNSRCWRGYTAARRKICPWNPSLLWPFKSQWYLCVPPAFQCIYNSAFIPQSVLVGFVWFSGKTTIISVNNINKLMFVMEDCCVFFEVRIKWIIYRRSSA
jgi:hypothetical protein